MGDEKHYDVIIIGSGIAGLMAARKLLEQKATTGSKILFIEALDRIGGRLLKLTHNDLERKPNNPVDVGACWICPEQPEVWKLAEEFGLTIVKQEDRGIRVVLEAQGGITGWIGRLVGVIKDEHTETHSSLMKLPPMDIISYLRLGKKFERMAKEMIVDSERPWDCPDAEKWDNMTCEEYLMSNVTNTAARGLMRSALLAIFCLPPTDYSMLWFLTNLKAEGTFQMFTEGAQSHRVVECNGTYPIVLEKELKEAGVTFLLDTRVTAVSQPDPPSGGTEGGGGIVIASDNKSGSITYKSKRAIVTIPPPHMKNVTFTPKLPQEPYQKEMIMGKCIKTVLAYEKRWWDGSFGFADPKIGGPISLVADVSNDNGKEAMLATFYYGRAAEEYTGDENKSKRKSASVAGAQRILCDDDKNGQGPPELSKEEHVLSVVEGDWPSTPYIEGAYAAVAKVGAITKTKMYHRALQQQFGLLHFAGTECADHWAGYIEGAIVTGRKAAMEIVEAGL